MPDPAENPELTLTEEQLREAGLLMEAAPTGLIVPKRGDVFDSDGACKVAIIRPCVSRGKRVRGLPPIYTPRMLAENASVFSGWLMYMDHLTEEIVEALSKRQRSVKELGGRLLESYYDPEYVHPDDEKFGHQKGAVIGRALPRRVVREMLEDDPELLHVSINAYPSGLRGPTSAPWDAQARGMLVEGIRKKPEGTVDWVPRGGAGGRVLQELEVVLERLAEPERGSATVSVPDRSYASATMPDLKDMTRDQLAEALRTDNPSLAEALGLTSAAPTPPTPPASQGGSGSGLSQEELDRRLAEQRDELLAESEAAVEDRASELIQEREQYRALEKIAHVMIRGSGLPDVYQADLRRRWSVMPSGPTAALASVEPLMESDGVVAVDDKGKAKDAAYMLREAVQADLDHAVELVEAAGGSPRVRGLGGGTGGHEGRRRPAAGNSFRDFLRESGDFDKIPDGKTEDDVLKTNLSEAVSD